MIGAIGVGVFGVCVRRFERLLLSVPFVVGPFVPLTTVGFGCGFVCCLGRDPLPVPFAVGPCVPVTTVGFGCGFVCCLGTDPLPLKEGPCL